MFHVIKLLYVCSWYWWVVCNPCLAIAVGLDYLLFTYNYFILGGIFAGLAVAIYLFFSIQILKGVKHRLEIYYRLSNLFMKNKNVKKSILFELKETHCESKVCDLICEENDIKLI